MSSPLRTALIALALLAAPGCLLPKLVREGLEVVSGGAGGAGGAGAAGTAGAAGGAGVAGAAGAAGSAGSAGTAGALGELPAGWASTVKFAAGGEPVRLRSPFGTGADVLCVEDGSPVMRPAGACAESEWVIEDHAASGPDVATDKRAARIRHVASGGYLAWPPGDGTVRPPPELRRPTELAATPERALWITYSDRGYKGIATPEALPWYLGVDGGTGKLTLHGSRPTPFELGRWGFESADPAASYVLLVSASLTSPGCIVDVSSEAGLLTRCDEHDPANHWQRIEIAGGVTAFRARVSGDYLELASSRHDLAASRPPPVLDARSMHWQLLETADRFVMLKSDATSELVYLRASDFITIDDVERLAVDAVDPANGSVYFQVRQAPR
jgi:hypothetical protein